ncbi:HotDog domain-containing protein [Lentinula edodes]|uniref:HotDog domain-containing protein n=1 Tax=Lentinula lateritia TaxID=40482 RepID=A0A9W9E1Y6_9AGAR|nr:HotDog domain-containing protein [Lentinula edodes]
MAAEISKLIGYELPDRPVSWLKRDLILYALGIGAKDDSDDLSFIYELDPNFAAFPTYPVVLTFKGDSQELNLFAETMKSSALPGLPPVDLGKSVHGSQSIEILKPLPLTSGPGWKWKTKYTGVSENKSGVVITNENLLVDPQGVPYARLYSSSFNIGMKITGQKFAKVIAGPPQAKPIPKDRKADWVVRQQSAPDQALLYRLSGDYNPLHIDPQVGRAAGFGGTILHGLATFGFAARALLNAIAYNEPESLKFFGVRFTSPVKPGDVLETHAWEVGPGPDGTIEVAFVTKNLTSGKDALGGGIAYITKAQAILASL